MVALYRFVIVTRVWPISLKYCLNQVRLYLYRKIKSFFVPLWKKAVSTAVRGMAHSKRWDFLNEIREVCLKHVGVVSVDEVHNKIVLYTFLRFHSSQRELKTLMVIRVPLICWAWRIQSRWKLLYSMKFRYTISRTSRRWFFCVKVLAQQKKTARFSIFSRFSNDSDCCLFFH